MNDVEKMGMSLIVPFLNEEEGIVRFCEELDSYVASLDFAVEIVFVNDGSTDGTVEKILNYSFANIELARIINLSKNFGSHAAIRAGLTKASFEICTWLGSDLQEPLEIIPLSYEKIVKEGYDAVYIEKKSVGVSSTNRLFSKFYSGMMRKYAVKNYSSGGTSTIVFNSKIKEYLNSNIESNSSIMLQILDAGFKSYTVSVDYGERFAGKSKWTLSKKIKLFIDSFVSFSFMPIRMVSIVGVFLFLVGMIIGIITIVNRFVNPLAPMGYTSLTSILSLGFGITNVSLGIIAEYLWRTFDAARNRPVYIISDEITVGGKDEKSNQ